MRYPLNLDEIKSERIKTYKDIFGHEPQQETLRYKKLELNTHWWGWEVGTSDYHMSYYNDIRTMVERYSIIFGLVEGKDWSLKSRIEFNPTFKHDGLVLQSLFRKHNHIFFNDSIVYMGMDSNFKVNHYIKLSKIKREVYNIMKEISSKSSHVGSPVNHAVGWKV